MQQGVEEGGEGGFGEGASYTYDNMFPALPDSANPMTPQVSAWGVAANNKMRVGNPDITQVSLFLK